MERVKELYLSGLSAIQIKNELGLSQSVRQIQRWIKSMGIIRTSAEAYRLASSQGRIERHKKPIKFVRLRISNKTRYQVFQKFNNRCAFCGATAEYDILQVDHIDNDPNNNEFSNLQILCESCNKGKYLSIPC